MIKPIKTLRGVLTHVCENIPVLTLVAKEHFLSSAVLSHGWERIEVLAVEVTINKEKWLFISMYKQPKVKANNIINCVDNIMNHCINFDCNIVIMGDLNVNMLKRNKCFKGTPSLIDLIVTNKHKRFKCTISADTGLSDFDSMVCTSTKFHVPKQKLTTFTYISYKHFNNESFLSNLSIILYHITEIFDDIDDAYSVWNDLTMQVFNEHAPIKSKLLKVQKSLT